MLPCAAWALPSGHLVDSERHGIRNSPIWIHNSHCMLPGAEVDRFGYQVAPIEPVPHLELVHNKDGRRIKILSLHNQLSAASLIFRPAYLWHGIGSHDRQDQ